MTKIVKKQQITKPPHERLENLRGLAGRNLPLAIVAEQIDLDKRLSRIERFMRKYESALNNLLTDEAK